VFPPEDTIGDVPVTDVTVPPPAGVTQVPSLRKKVVVDVPIAIPRSIAPEALVSEIKM
jgi:hypothetical protein